jgi:ribonuclease T1
MMRCWWTRVFLFLTALGAIATLVASIPAYSETEQQAAGAQKRVRSDSFRQKAGEVSLETLPAEARATVARIKQGGPFPYRKDGTTFGNREHRLQARARGYYKEYTVPTPGSHDRGARRIIAGGAGEMYYTDDHYNTFRLIKE